jgi:hypothetical protein
MIFALGTPINAQTKPWKYDWIVQPDAIMISAIDFFDSPKLFERVIRKGIHDFLNWDGPIFCDSGAFSAINRKKAVSVDVSQLKAYYRLLNQQHPEIIKISLDYPDDKILENYDVLYPYDVQPVVPYDRLDILDYFIKNYDLPEWYYFGRLVPLMRKGSGSKNRLISTLGTIRDYLHKYSLSKKSKIWALGVGAPTILNEIQSLVDGCDSSRWRITGANMILLPFGGERGVGNITKWRGTHYRINEGEEKQMVISILKQIDYLSGGLELLDEPLSPKNKPKQLKGVNEHNLPLMEELITLIRDDDKEPSIYDLELILRSSGKLRFIFNYITALFYKMKKFPITRLLE